MRKEFTEGSLCQAEQKTAPTNPMKEVRIDKLVLSALYCLPL